MTNLIFPKDVEGWLWKEEGEILFELAQENKELGVVVELGSYHGKSTICLAQGSKKVDGGKIYNIDNFIGDKYTGIKKTSFYKKFLSNIKKYKLDDLIEPIIGDFTLISKSWNKPIRLLFIDGAHGYEDVKRDFENWEPKVAKGGIIVFHDSLVWPKVSKFVREAIESDKFTNIKTFKTKAGITYLTKPKTKERIPDNNFSLEEFDRLLKSRTVKRMLLAVKEKIFIRS